MSEEQATQTQQAADAPASAPVSGQSANDVEALRKENARLREDIRKAAEARDAARDKARGEVSQQLDVMLQEFQTLKATALADRARAVDTEALQALPESMRPIGKKLLAGLRAEDPTLAITADADVDALAAQTRDKLAELLKGMPSVSTMPPHAPAPKTPDTQVADWRTMKPDELRKHMQGL